MIGSDHLGSPAGRAPPRWWRRGVLLVGFWSLLGLLATLQVYVFYSGYRVLPFVDILVWQTIDWYFWIPVTPLILWLGRRFPLERQTWALSLAVHLLAAVALSILHLANSTAIGILFGVPKYETVRFFKLLSLLFGKYIHLDIVTYGCILAGGFAYRYHSKFREEKLVASQLESRLAVAELQALKMQLHPHFLFNTLHTIGVLVRKQDTQAAVKMLTGVSDLLRATLDSAGKHEVSLWQELDFLDRYLAIEKMRFGDRLVVTMNIEPGVSDARVPNLILQPLVENAIRHGIAPHAAGGSIRIDARRDADVLRLEVVDDGAGLSSDPAEASGMGLRNVRARLEQMYGDEAQFSIRDRDSGGVAVELAFPLRFEDETRDA